MTTLLLAFLLSAQPAHACMEMASFRKLFRGGFGPYDAAGPREAVVLFDDTWAYEGVGAQPVAVHLYGTGECVEVIEERAEAALIRRAGASPAWVEKSRLYVFDRPAVRYDYGAFFAGGRLAEPPGRPSRGLSVVESKEFALRASRNQRSSVRIMGLRRLFGLSKGHEADSYWAALQEERARRSPDPVLAPIRMRSGQEWEDASGGLFISAPSCGLP